MKQYIGHKLTINSIEYTFNIDEEFPVWNSEKYTIYAPVHYEDVPLTVSLLDSEANVLEESYYYEDVSSFEDYCNVVKVLASVMISKYEGSD